MAFDHDFYDPDFTWALQRLYLCTVVERNLAEVVADLPATFTIIRGLHHKGLSVLSRSNQSNTERHAYGSHSQGSHANKRSMRTPKAAGYSRDIDNETDEIPLKDSVPVDPGSRDIRMHTRIDVSTHSAETLYNSQANAKSSMPWTDRISL